jgi:hypothetical protein
MCFVEGQGLGGALAPYMDGLYYKLVVAVSHIQSMKKYNQATFLKIPRF